jgi:hypothetical protein
MDWPKAGVAVCPISARGQENLEGGGSYVKWHPQGAHKSLGRGAWEFGAPWGVE